MAAIDNLNRELAILMVAHRLSTLQNCDLIVQLESGKIVSQGPYAKVGTAQANADKTIMMNSTEKARGEK